DLLLMDEANPRSVAYQLARLREHVDYLPSTRTSIRRGAEARLSISLLAAVQLAEVRDLGCADGRGTRANLEKLLNRIATELRQLSETLTREYFNQAGPSRRFSVP
ncbi:MAG: alpha-E domain-containing protein, partial [Acidobacteriia bacterium]|nr:alpha-E domain-containing protein [Terriglobia bacterium]